MSSDGLLAVKLKTLRQNRGVTQEELASKAGVSYSTVSKLEQGSVKTPSVRTLQKLMLVLSYDLDEILSDEPLKLRRQVKYIHKKPPAPVKFIYFDIGGVLVHWHRALHAFAARIHRPFDDVMQVFHQFNAAACRGLLTEDDLKVLYLLRLNVDYSGKRRETYFRPWYKDIRPIKSSHLFVKEVSTHYSTGLLSNISSGTYPDFVSAGLIPDASYKAVVRSCDVGTIKPERSIYEIATQAARTPAENILFIDDTKINVSAARAFGWQAEWFDEHRPAQSIERIRAKYFA